MTGLIKSYNEEKGFGFIEGMNNKSYFFHKNDIAYTDFNLNDLVCFEDNFAKKGYFAKNIKLNNSILYEVPKQVYVSKSDDIKGWEVLEETDWTFHSSSRSSPNSAKNNLLEIASNLNANAILNLTYYSSTGSEAGTGKGTHYYTIHHYSGNFANIAKKSLTGTLKKEDVIKNIQETSDALYSTLQIATKKSMIKSFSIWGFIILFSLLCYAFPLFLNYIKDLLNVDYPVYIFFPLIIFGFMFGQYTVYTKDMTK